MLFDILRAAEHNCAELPKCLCTGNWSASCTSFSPSRTASCHIFKYWKRKLSVGAEGIEQGEGAKECRNEY
jgi:hypothetical protein